MTADTEMIEQLLRSALDSYKQEHRVVSETWKHLESKAQGTIAISGILLAGVFAFVRMVSVASATHEKLLLMSAVLMLLLSVIFAVCVLRIREVAGAPLGDDVRGLVEDLLAGGEVPSPEEISNFINDQAGMWSEVNKQVDAINQCKASYLFRSQKVLLIAIMLVATLTIIAIWK